MPVFQLGLMSFVCLHLDSSCFLCLTVTVVTCNVCYIMPRLKSHRREDLLNASIEYMLEKGVADLSLRPLAAKVGSKARLLVYHFGSKDALITDAMLVVRERVQGNLAALVRNRRDPKPSQVVLAFWGWATSKEHERYLRLFFEVHGLALQNPQQYGRYLEGAFTSWVELMSAILPAKLSRPERRALASLAVGTVVGLMLDYLSSGDKKRTSDAVAVFAKHFDGLLQRTT
jgi:AcrR family transcriptional regulator